MAGRPTFNPRKEKIPQEALQDGPNRNITTVTLGGSSTGAFNRMVFVGGAEQPRITSVKWFPQVAVYHAAAEADTWIFNLVNQSTGATLNSVAASLSNQTLAVTAFKTLLVDNGNSTLGNGGTLQLRLTVSGVPQTLNDSTVQITWEPTKND